MWIENFLFFCPFLSFSIIRSNYKSVENLENIDYKYLKEFIDGVSKQCPQEVPYSGIFVLLTDRNPILIFKAFLLLISSSCIYSHCIRQ